MNALAMFAEALANVEPTEGAFAAVTPPAPLSIQGCCTSAKLSVPPVVNLSTKRRK
jgi:hypothetical protein